jgi:hypothetical protein
MGLETDSADDGSAGDDKSGQPVVRARPARSFWRPSGKALLLQATALLAVAYALKVWSGQGRQGRVETACSSILNVINPEGSTFEQLGSSLSAGGSVARMLYTITDTDGRSKRAIILCAFDAAASFAQPAKLIAVSVNGQQLGPARLSFLNRFWLPSKEASAGLPSGAPAPPAQSQSSDKKTTS